MPPFRSLRVCWWTGWGIRRAYAVGFLFWSLASASISLSRGTGDVVAMRLVLGLAESIGPLASMAFIRNNFAGKDQGLPTSIYIAGQNIGPALGALLGTILLDRFGWRMMFALTGSGGVDLAAVLAGLQYRRTPPVPRTSGSRNAGASKVTRGACYSRGRTFWAMSLCILLSSYYWYFVLTWVPSYLVLSRGFDTLGMGRVISTALFTMAAVNVMAGFAADKLAVRRGVFPVRLAFAVAGYVGTAAVLLLLVVPDNAPGSCRC